MVGLRRDGSVALVVLLITDRSRPGLSGQSLVLSDSDGEPAGHFYSHQACHFRVGRIDHYNQSCPVVAEDGLFAVGADRACAYHSAGLTRFVGQLFFSAFSALAGLVSVFSAFEGFTFRSS